MRKNNEETQRGFRTVNIYNEDFLMRKHKEDLGQYLQ